MPERKAYSYAVVRVVPRVERDEFINAGVIVFSQELRFLGARVFLDEARLRALDGSADVGAIRRHLAVVPRICAGDVGAGPIARLPMKDRFHWLTAPRSAGGVPRTRKTRAVNALRGVFVWILTGKVWTSSKWTFARSGSVRAWIPLRDLMRTVMRTG